MNSNELELFKKTFNVLLPKDAFEKIELLYNDGDKTNQDPDNLDYYFKGGPVESPYYPGFYHIPGYSRYAINKEGKIIEVVTGKAKVWTRTKPYKKKNITGGYFVTTAICDKTLTVKRAPRHRLLCLTFKHPGEPVNKLVVNHEDGIPGNDDLDNIYFCTYSHNTKHAYERGLYPNKVTPVTVLNWKTGDEFECPTVAEASLKTGVVDVTLFGRLRKNNGNRYPDGWRIKRAGDTWEPLKKRGRVSSRDVDVICYNVLTGVVYNCGSLRQAHEMTGIQPKTVQAQITRETRTPFQGWLFRNLKDFKGFPKFGEKQLELLKVNPSQSCPGVEVFDRKEKTTTLYQTVRDAADAFGLSTITMGRLGKRGAVRDSRFEIKLVSLS